MSISVRTCTAQQAFRVCRRYLSGLFFVLSVLRRLIVGHAGAAAQVR